MSTGTVRPGDVAGNPTEMQQRPESAVACCTPATAVAQTAPVSTCCGTAAEARAEGSCCAAAAKQEAVASGAGCCG